LFCSPAVLFFIFFSWSHTPGYPANRAAHRFLQTSFIRFRLLNLVRQSKFNALFGLSLSCFKLVPKKRGSKAFISPRVSSESPSSATCEALRSSPKKKKLTMARGSKTRSDTHGRIKFLP
jgi:hypothetical protein